MKRFFHDIRRYAGYALYSAQSSLKAEVANSYLNWLWWILEPLLFMFVYMFIGEVVFQYSMENYAIFVFIGLTIWNFFSKNVLASVKLVTQNKGVISKIYLPKYVLVLSKMINNFIKMLISFGIILVMMIFYRCPFTWKLIYLLPILCFLALFTFGCCCIVMHCGVFVEDLHNLINVALRLIFYLSGVFYSTREKFLTNKTGMTRLIGQGLLYGNPVAFCIDLSRGVLLSAADPTLNNYWIYGIWITVSLLLSAFGVWLIYRYENSYVKVI